MSPVTTVSVIAAAITTALLFAEVRRSDTVTITPKNIKHEGGLIAGLPENDADNHGSATATVSNLSRTLFSPQVISAVTYRTPFLPQDSNVLKLRSERHSWRIRGNVEFVARQLGLSSSNREKLIKILAEDGVAGEDLMYRAQRERLPEEIIAQLQKEQNQELQRQLAAFLTPEESAILTEERRQFNHYAFLDGSPDDRLSTYGITPKASLFVIHAIQKIASDSVLEQAQQDTNILNERKTELIKRFPAEQETELAVLFDYFTQFELYNQKKLFRN